MVFFLFVVVVPRLLFSDNQRVIFNQHYIETLHGQYNSESIDAAINRIVSFQTLTWNSLLNDDALNFDLNNQFSVFAYVFNEIPYYAVVYPTETYYYFRIPEKGVSGNLRFVDIDKGVVYLGYFIQDRPHSEEGGSGAFTLEDGAIIKKMAPDLYSVSFKGKTVFFKLPSAVWNLPPAKLALLPEEEFIARIQDESGIRFFFIYNSQTKAFYYILNEEQPVPEELNKIFDSVYAGARTGYAYYEDTNHERKILFGVKTANIWENNYFDGPFDQVPPRLNIRDKLYAAYPYTQYLHGLDEHGNFIDFEGSRVAISAYTDYSQEAELRERITGCDQNSSGNVSSFWSCLAYEPKKDFHKTIPEFFYEDGKCKNNCLLQK